MQPFFSHFDTARYVIFCHLIAFPRNELGFLFHKQTTMALLLVLFCFGCSQNASTNQPGHQPLTHYVNPFIGTGGHGHTFPGATMPFGMVQLSPDTRLTGWDGCSGYHYSDSIVYGFSHTHLSGTGVSDYGDVLLMPVLTDDLHYNNGADTPPGYRSPFSKEKESAQPGYYQTHLDRYDIGVELTVTPRAGIHRYHFPSEEGVVLVDLRHRDKTISSELKQINELEVAGHRISTEWAKEQHIYFVIQFSRPIDKITGQNQETAPVQALHFKLPDENTLLAKVGISAVSIEGARKNLTTEMPHFDFEAYRQNAREAWEQQLQKIEVKGGTANQKTIFYTALYHTMIAPNLYQDVDGQYRGMDLNVHPNTSQQHTHYTVFSLWDTYRGAHPLYTLIERERTNDFIRTFLDNYDKGGILPIWELSANYTGCMIGYHAIPVIADAYQKGIRDYDAQKALQAMQHSAMQDHLGLEAYKQKGYIPAEMESESVSKTLEYAYDDWCIAQMARSMGAQDVYQQYIRRAQYYKNVFDPATGFMRPKNNETWIEPFDPAEVNFHFTEANCWQYSFYVPQDVEGLIRLLGGKKALEQKLDSLFSASPQTTGRNQADITGLIGQYAHGNEPSHHMAYLYNYVGTPWKTQQRVRQIMNNLYHNQPDGLSGNEDCGQMSAWYVLSALGFYPVTPASNIYAIGSPVFEEATIHQENGKDIVIKANNNDPDNDYIQSMTLNGEAYSKCYIDHNDLSEGAILQFEMNANPNKDWATAHSPPSRIDESLIMPSPFVGAGDRVFKQQTHVSLGSIEKGAKIYYTTDGRSPLSSPDRALYEQPVAVDQTTVFSFFATKDGLPDSRVVEATFIKIPANRKVQLLAEYAPQYAASGNDALIDLLRGGADFRTGTWQGYQGTDLEAVVDLGKRQRVRKIGLGCLQDQNSWIFMPSAVYFEGSTDGQRFHPLGSSTNTIDPRKDGAIIREFEIETNTELQFIRVKALNAGPVPSWHKGAGGDSWIFADEILVTTQKE